MEPDREMEARALKNSSVSYFSEGAGLQGRWGDENQIEEPNPRKPVNSAKSNPAPSRTRDKLKKQFLKNPLLGGAWGGFKKDKS